MCSYLLILFHSISMLLVQGWPLTLEEVEVEVKILQDLLASLSYSCKPYMMCVSSY